MPIKKSAEKSLRKRIKQDARNTLAKAELHSLRVKLRKLSTSGKVEEAKEIGKTIGKKLDKAVSRGILKKNTVSRLKSRMMKKLNALKSK
jgi:small subunit ribosomal protein S20